MRLNLRKQETYTLKVVVTPNLLEGVKGDREKAVKDIAASYAAHQLHKDFEVSKEEMTSLLRKRMETHSTIKMVSDGSIEVTMIDDDHEIDLATINEYSSRKMLDIKNI